jgi:hypothetical protein
MHTLYAQELYLALEYAKTMDQDSGKRIMVQLEIDQPLLFNTLFKTFPSIISERHDELANLFVDLCFDIVCVYQKSFGKLPKFKDDPTWMERQVMGLDKELKPLMEGRHISAKRSQRMKDDFFASKAGEVGQNGLVAFLHEAVDDFVAEDGNCDIAAADMAKAMLFVATRFFTNLYSKASATIH